MRNNFNANVPSRKPRTQIGRVLGELASDPGERAAAHADDGDTLVIPLSTELDDSGDLAEVEADASVRPRSARDAEAAAPAIPFPPVSRSAPVDEGRREGGKRYGDAPDRLSSKGDDGSRLAASRQRLATLRERLVSAAQPATAATDPRRTAATVRGVIEELRARLDAAAQEQSRLASTLEETGVRLDRAEAELARERKARAAAEMRAEERQRIADDAVVEAEALAAERDQVLAELADQRSLDNDQAALLVDAEAALALRDAERASADREMTELRDLLDLRALDVADLESRLTAANADRARLEARLRDMQGELDRLSEAGDALEDIEAMVIRRER